MKITEMIQERRSVRTFTGEPLTEEIRKQLLDFAQSAENPYGLPIEYRILNAEEHGLNSPVVVGAEYYIAGKIKKAPHAEEAFGYSFEKIVLFAQSIGLSTVWIAGTMNRDAFERAMELGDDEIMPCVSPIGYQAQKMSVRETMMRKGIKADSRLDFGELFFDGSPVKHLNPNEAGVFKTPLEMVRLAPSAVNKQPWRVIIKDQTAHFYKRSSKGYSNGAMDIQKIDVGIALYHFAAAALEEGFSVKFQISDPGISVPDEWQYTASYIRVQTPNPV